MMMENADLVLDTPFQMKQLNLHMPESCGKDLTMEGKLQKNKNRNSYI